MTNKEQQSSWIKEFECKFKKNIKSIFGQAGSIDVTHSKILHQLLKDVEINEADYWKNLKTRLSNKSNDHR